MNLKDHSVSGERFKLLVDPYYGFLYTDPKPSDKDLKAYYSDVGYISHNNQLRSFVDAMYHVARYVSLKRKIRLIKPFMLVTSCGIIIFVSILLYTHRHNNIFYRVITVILVFKDKHYYREMFFREWK